MKSAKFGYLVNWREQNILADAQSNENVLQIKKQCSLES
jgi:hypothetical protein